MIMTEQQQGQVPPNQARRTIKLKPLTKKVPKVMMTPEQIAQAAEASQNQPSQGATIMQTNNQEPKPVTLSTPTVISPAVTQKSEANDTIVLKPPTPPAEEPLDESTKKVGKQTASTVSPLSIMPNAKQTIKLRPTPAVASPEASAVKAPGAPTIKLSPSSAPVAPEEVEEEIFDDKTVAVARPQRTNAATVPGSLIPAAAPESLPASEPEVVRPSAPTLKLKPKMPTSVQPAAAPVPVSPSAPTLAQPKSPTIKLKVNTSSITQSSPAASPSAPPPPPSSLDGTAPTVPTLKLKPPTTTPSSQTIPAPAVQTSSKLVTPPPPPADAAPADASKSKLQLKKTPPPPTMKEGELAPANAPTYSEQQAKEAAGENASEVPAAGLAAAVGRDEPSMIFSIAAILAFCAISFVVYMVSWQYYLQWMKPGVPSTVAVAAVAPKSSAASPKATDKKETPAPVAADKKDTAQPPVAAKKDDAKK